MMKHLLTILLSLWLTMTTVFAQDQIPYKTFTESITGERVETQLAYEPDQTIQLNLENPSGFAYDEDTNVYYISDEEKSLVMVVDLENSEEKIIQHEEFQTPQGLYVDNQKIYVADEKAESVFIFDKNNHRVLQTLRKPKDPLYGLKEKFRPTRLVVSEQNIMYVLSKGNNGGLIRFNQDGEFMGYFASNDAQSGFFTWLKDKFFTEKQKAKFFKNVPSTPSSMSIDEQGLVYTVTQNLQDKGLKKFNAAGINLFYDSDIKFSQYDFSDVDVDIEGNIYVLFLDGSMNVFNPNGQLFFTIESPFSYQSLKGQVEEASHLHVDSQRNIHILDKRNASIQVYKMSEYAEKLYGASVYYQDGQYQEGETLWEDVRRQNASYRLPHQALAKSHFQKREYRDALNAFALANDRIGYSNAFWEIRNNFFQEYLGIFFTIALVIPLLYLLFKRSTIYQEFKDRKKECFVRLKKTSIVEFFQPLYLSLQDPREAFYQLRYFEIVSVGQASAFYLLSFLVYLLSFPLKGFLFAESIQDQTIMQTIFVAAIPLIFMIISNYLVSTIHDGEGRFKDVYTAGSLIFAPYIVWAIPIYFISNFLTLNEAFVFEFLMFLLLIAVVYRLFAMIQEIHNYSFKETLKNLFLTVFTAIMIVLFLLMIYVFAYHLIEVIVGMVKEVLLRG